MRAPRILSVIAAAAAIILTSAAPAQAEDISSGPVPTGTITTSPISGAIGFLDPPVIGHRTWTLTGTTTATLTDAAGRPVPWAEPPQPGNDSITVTPPILSAGHYTLTQGTGSLALTIPGVDLADLTKTGTTSSTPADTGPNLLLLGSGALLVLTLAGGVLVATRNRRAGIAIAGGGAALALLTIGASIALPSSGDYATASSGNQALPLGPTGVPTDATLTAVFRACGQRGDSNAVQACYDQAAARVLISGGVPSAGAALNAVGHSDIPSCHEVAHSLGRATWYLTRDPRQAAGVANPGICTHGYVHGVLEASAEYLDPGQLADAADVICKADMDGATNEPGADAEQRAIICYHGVGHALIRRTNGNLTTSLAACQNLPGRRGEECQVASVMEWSRLWTAADSTHKPIGADGDRPTMAACQKMDAELDETYASCWAGAANALARDADPIDLAKWCTTDAGDHVPECIVGVSSSLSNFNNTMSTIESRCRQIGDLGDPSWLTKCVVSTSYMLAATKRDDPMSICTQFSPDLQPACREGVEGSQRAAVAIGDTANMPQNAPSPPAN